MDTPNEVIKPPSWVVVASVLIVEHKTCSRCGEEYSTPNNRLMYRLLNRNSHTKSSRLIQQSETKYQPTSSLPRELETVHSTAEACSHCFSTNSLRSQLQLWNLDEYEMPQEATPLGDF